MSQNPNSLANLKPPFKPGQSGNPKGAVKKEIKREDWQEFAAEPGGVDKNGKDLPSRERLVMLATFKCATDLRRKDCTAAQKTFFERVQGRLKQALDLSSADGSMSPNRKPTTAETRQELDRVLAAIKEEVEAGQTNTEPKDEP